MKSSAMPAGLPLAVVMAILLLAAADPFVPVIFHYRLIMIVSIVGLLVCFAGFYQQRHDAQQCALGRSFAFLIGTAALLLTVYINNRTHRAVEGVGLLPVDHFRFLPGSAHAGQTAGSLNFMITGLSVLGCSLLLTRSAIRTLTWLLLSSGMVMAGLVLLQRLSPRPFPVYEFTGIFVSENHYAAFANLIIPLALATGARFQYKAFMEGRVSSPAFLLYGVAAIMAGSIYLARSRAGLSISVLLLLAFVCQQWILRRQFPFIAPPVAPLLKWMSIVVVVVALLSSAVLIGRQWRNTAQFAGELSYRGRIVLDSLAMWKDRPWWGVGPGAYASAYPYYQHESMQNRFIRHAHNEPVEFLAEYGIFGVGIMAAVGAGFIRTRRKMPNERNEMLDVSELENSAMALALAGVLLHALVDFPFRMPLISLVAMTFIGVVVGHSTWVFDGWKTISKNRKR